MNYINNADIQIKHRTELAKCKDYLDINDVSLLTGYSVSTLRRRISEGRLKCTQSIKRGKLLFLKDDIERFLGFISINESNN